MLSQHKHDYISNFSVKVKFDQQQGTGVLIKSNHECYLFTAKHNFKKELVDTFKNVDINNLKNRINDIQVTVSNEVVTKVERIVYNKNDLILFKVQNNYDYIKNLPELEVLKDNHFRCEYFFYGYPNDKSGRAIPLKYSSSNQEDEYTFRLTGDKNIKQKDLKGFSGSGIFVDIEDICYLVGILTESEDRLFYYKAINLSSIIEEINYDSGTQIMVKEYIITVDFTKNIYTRIIKRNNHINLVSRLIEILGDEATNLSSLRKNEKLKDAASYFEANNRTLLKLEKELADMYLLGAILHKYNNDNDAKKLCFDKAEKFNKQYKRYKEDENGLDDADNEYSELDSLDKGILYFHKGNFISSKETLESLIKDENYNKNKELYEYISKIYQKDEEYSKSVSSYKKLISLYNDSEFLKKSEIYYELSKIYESDQDIDNALLSVKRGLDISSQDESNSTLKVRYNLEKQRDKLLGIDNSKDFINPTLIKLVKRNPDKYLSEFLDLYFYKNDEVSNNDIHSEISDLKAEFLQDQALKKSILHDMTNDIRHVRTGVYNIEKNNYNFERSLRNRSSKSNKLIKDYSSDIVKSIKHTLLEVNEKKVYPMLERIDSYGYENTSSLKAINSNLTLNQEVVNNLSKSVHKVNKRIKNNHYRLYNLKKELSTTIKKIKNIDERILSKDELGKILLSKIKEVEVNIDCKYKTTLEKIESDNVSLESPKNQEEGRESLNALYEKYQEELAGLLDSIKESISDLENKTTTSVTNFVEKIEEVDKKSNNLKEKIQKRFKQIDHTIKNNNWGEINCNMENIESNLSSMAESSRKVEQSISDIENKLDTDINDKLDHTLTNIFKKIGELEENTASQEKLEDILKSEIDKIKSELEDKHISIVKQVIKENTQLKKIDDIDSKIQTAYDSCNDNLIKVLNGINSSVDALVNKPTPSEEDLNKIRENFIYNLNNVKEDISTRYLELGALVLSEVNTSKNEVIDVSIENKNYSYFLSITILIFIVLYLYVFLYFIDEYFDISILPDILRVLN